MIMGRNTKATQRPPPAENAMNREASVDILHQDESRASSCHEATAASTNCDLGLSHQQTRPYLSLEQMASLEPSTKVNLDVSHLVGKDCTIYSDVVSVLGCVQAFKTSQSITSQHQLGQTSRQLAKMVKQQGPEEIFSRMNCGTEADLMEWQQFSFLCFGSVVYQYLVHGTPLRVWVDDDVLPPAKRIVRERARLNALSYILQKTGKLEHSMMEEAMRTCAGPAPTLHELGDDDVVHLDMEEFVGRQMVVSAPREPIKFLYNMLHPLNARPLSRSVFKTMYTERLGRLQGIKADSDTHCASTIMMVNCVEVAVLARLLYDKSIRTKQTEADHVQESDECSTDDCFPGMFYFPEPSPEMLCPIIIPDSVAVKGGYIVAGEFRTGHGNETVHLKFSDFNPDDAIILHLGSDLDANLLLLSYFLNTDFINTVIECKKRSSKDTCEKMTECLNTLHRLPDDPLFVHELQLGGLDAYEQLGEVYELRVLVPPIRQALHGTPARLFYTSDHSIFEDDPLLFEYLNHVRELCSKKLGQSSGACVMQG